MQKQSIIPRNELMRRWSQVRTELEQSGKDALLVPLGINFYYLFGKLGKPSERLIAGIIPRDGDPFIISPAFEKENITISTGIEDIVTWEETESPYKLLNIAFDDRKIGKEVQVDPHLWVIELENLSKATNKKFSAANLLFKKLRSIKSVWEVEQLQKAAKASTQGILASIPHLKEGMTELEFLKIVQKEMSDRSGSDLAFGLVQFGKNTAVPHGMPSTKKLRRDEVALIDCGTPVNGYQGDITITIPFGNPPEFKKIYDIVYEANRVAFNKDKSGIIASELDNISRNYIEERGFGKYFTHRLGHGIGLEVHEEPYIVGNNHLPLITGNCHTIEPGIYIPGKFGVRIEDDILVSDNGAERLFDTPRYNFE